MNMEKDSITQLACHSFREGLSQFLKMNGGEINSDYSQQENIQYPESQSDEDSGTQQPFDLRTQMSILRGNTKLEDENGGNQDLETPRDQIKHNNPVSCSGCDLLLSLNYLRQRRLLCDVIFQVKMETFYAHRAVMASCSDVYRERYLEELRSNKQKFLDVFRVEGIPTRIFQQVIDFVYTANLELNEDCLMPLLDAARLLKINSLVQKCKSFSQRKLSNSNIESENNEKSYENDFCENFHKETNDSLENVFDANLSKSKLKTEDHVEKMDLSKSTGNFQQQLCLKNHDSIFERNQSIVTQPSGVGETSKSDVVLASSPLQDRTYSKSLSRKNSVSSKSSDDRLVLEDENPIFSNNSSPHQHNALSSIKDCMSMAFMNGDLRNFYPPSMLLRQERANENFWANFIRKQLSKKEESPLTHYDDFSSNSFPMNGQSSHNWGFSNFTLNSPFNKTLNKLQNARRMESSDFDCTNTNLLSSASEQELDRNLPKTNLKLPSRKHSTKHDEISKPYSCPLCDAQFNRPANLKTHMRIHSGEKPYKCETCGARFVQVAHLRAHVLIHTGEKPYPCNVCGTSFRHLQTLKSHLRIHTGEKPYSCERCRVQFRHKSQLRLHLRTKHGVQTNTKKTYKQVPGLRSADISAHIKRAQEAAKAHSNSRTQYSSFFQQTAKENYSVLEENQSSKDDHNEKISQKFNSSEALQPATPKEELDCREYKLNVQAHFAKFGSEREESPDMVETNKNLKI